MFYDTASALFGVEGLRVTDAEAGPGGVVEVWAVTDYGGAAACPDCGTESSRVHEVVVTCPADVRRAGDPVALNWVKRRLKCGNAGCPRRTFTERCPAVPSGQRLVPRLREQCAAEVADRGITPAEAARHAGVSWPVAHGAFAARADAMLGGDPEPVAHLGIDEHRRGRPRWERDAETGQYVQLADRWHVNFCDLSGRQGMLGQVEGRTADDAAYWLLQAPPAWRGRVEVVAIDMCTVFLSAVRRVLPQAQVAVDLFHVVQLAVKAAGDARRRATREKYGRRGKEGDPEYGLKGLLNRNLESLSPAQFGKVIETLDADGHGQQIAIAWIAKEKLRAALNLRARFSRSQPCERQVRDRLFTFYDWCAAHEDIPELLTLATTISRWEEQIVTAVLTGVTNATSESLNRIAKLEARLAYGFRSPASQRRRVRTACTRGTRRRSPAATSPLRTTIEEMQARGVNILESPDYHDESGLLPEGQDRALGGDAAMTFREVSRDEVLAALGDGGEDSVLRACVAALRAYSRPSYTIGGSPANALRETLEVKYRHAASRGKTFVGDGELLLRLQELGSEPVTGVSAHHAGKNFIVYVTPLTLKPVGAVIMYDALRSEVTGG